MVVLDGYVLGCGVAVLSMEGRVLVGKRSDGQGWCLAGGKVDKGEPTINAARRELYEEFKIFVDTARLIHGGTIYSEAIVSGKKRPVMSQIFYTFLPSKEEETFNANFQANREMEEVLWLTMDEILAREDIFPPTTHAIEMLKKVVHPLKELKVTWTLE